jgi:flavin-dependent dehydrogenase
LDWLDVPQRYLMNAVRAIRLQPPDGRAPIEIRSRAYRFFMADVTGMLRWMAEHAAAHGAEIRCGAAFVDATREDDGRMLVSYNRSSQAPDGASQASQRASTESVYARFLIGADGPRSVVAERMGLDRNTRFLAGAEWLVEGVELEGDTFHLIMDADLAPGYCAWLAPHGEIAALGVAGHAREFKPTQSLRLAQERFAPVADLSKMRVVQRKGGTIPVGGRLRQVYRDDARGRALLLGDAAGLCGAATGGGIYPALISGRLAAQAVANETLNGSVGAVRAYLRDLPQAGRLGHYLKIEDWLRFALDRLSSNADVAAFYALFSTSEGHALLQRTLLETPIVSMDSHFFALLRALLGKHPAVYGSAVRAAWGRITARP